MIRGNKLYINITNHCDVCCPFCCMKSDSKKQSFMNFDTIHKIMKDMDVPYIVQLEGGEPTTHPQFYLFMEFPEKKGSSPTPIRRRRKTSGVSIWMWMILWISIRADNSRRIG